MQDLYLVAQNLRQHGFEVSVFESKEEAANYLNGKIDGKSVGFGGSVTLDQMQVCQMLDTHNKVLWRFSNPDGLTPAQVMKQSLTADVFLTSANAVSQSGEIVNIDGTCNRVAGELYGHEKVYIVVGKNKLAQDLHQAIWRARNIAAPKNAKRLNRNTPCAKNADRCYDCSSEERICKGLVVLWRKPSGCDYEVVLVNEELGF